MSEELPSEGILRGFRERAGAPQPVTNPFANFLPDRADQFRDLASARDFRLPNGVGVSRFYRKPDSQEAWTAEGMFGPVFPDKLPGTGADRSRPPARSEAEQRAATVLPQIYQRAHETPEGANFRPYEWNNLQASGSGGPLQSMYNRNVPRPVDAQAAARRLYQPAPNRLKKLLSSDVEEAALRPTVALPPPESDAGRIPYYRHRRNADVLETVQERSVLFSTRGAPRVWSDASVMRAPKGFAETGGARAVRGRWSAPDIPGGESAAQTLDDRLLAHREALRWVQGRMSPEQETLGEPYQPVPNPYR